MKPLSTDGLRTALNSGAAAFAAALNDELLNECAALVNERFSLRHISKLPSERLPTHQRNLTDTRTRIGILLEYSFGLALDRILSDRKLAVEFRVSFVVSNQYPDLVIRDPGGAPVVRLEVKALELVSEEKSANFDALVRDIHPGKDILLILVWEWQKATQGTAQVDFPEIKRAFALEAYPIARMRDLGWVAENDAILKGIDLLGPVVGDAQTLRKEEHNMGKLMRIAGDAEGIPETLKASPSVKKYEAFKTYTLTQGLLHNAAHVLSELKLTPSLVAFEYAAAELRIIATAATPEYDCIVAAGKATNLTVKGLIADLKAGGAKKPQRILVFTDKFFWRIFDEKGNSICNGRKIGPSIKALGELLQG